MQPKSTPQGALVHGC
jgi:hypothetical protein